MNLAVSILEKENIFKKTGLRLMIPRKSKMKNGNKVDVKEEKNLFPTIVLLPSPFPFCRMHNQKMQSLLS